MADIKIIKPCKTAMSSGRAKTKKWLIKFDEASQRYDEGLMGWTGTKDNRYQTKLQFESKEDAVAYADKQQLSYVVEDPHMSTPVIKSYGDNFSAYKIKG